MKILHLLALLASLALQPALAGEKPEKVVWRGTPLRVDLRIGEERILQVPNAGQVRAGLLGGPVPGLRIQVLGNHVYLLAREPFASTRMILQPDAGQPVLLDLAADGKFPAGEPLSILTSPHQGQPEGVQATPSRFEPPAPPVGYVTLVRHAAQSLYAPPRLAPDSSRIVSVPLHFRGALPLVRGGFVEAAAVASWRAAGAHGPLWVTAVRLRNLLDEHRVLDPRDLRGARRAASFQHARLAPFGDEADTTTVYLISGKPFKEVIASWTEPPSPLHLPAPSRQKADTRVDAASVSTDTGVLDR